MKELVTLVPLIIGTILLGVVPGLVFNVTQETTLRVLQMITGG